MRISLIGFGMAGRPLALGLARAGWDVAGIGVKIRGEAVAVALASGFRTFEMDKMPLDVDVLALCVPDDEIEHVVNQLAKREDSNRKGEETPPIVLHLAGRYGLKPLTALAERGWARLAWHPLQSFVAGVGPERLRGVTIGATADPEAWPLAETMADIFGARIWKLEEKDRVRYHRAAVVASNFLPALIYAAADDLLGIAPNRQEAVNGLLPLVRGMVSNLEERSIEEALSGPVIRDDLRAVQNHLDASDDELANHAYRSLSRLLLRLATERTELHPDRLEKWENLLRNSHNGDDKS